MSRRGICGNMLAIVSTSAGFAWPLVVVELEAEAEAGEGKRKYFTARAPRAARRRREGMETVWSGSDILAGIREGSLSFEEKNKTSRAD